MRYSAVQMIDILQPSITLKVRISGVDHALSNFLRLSPLTNAVNAIALRCIEKKVIYRAQPTATSGHDCTT